MTPPTVSVLTYNIHKGWAPWRTRVTIAAMREALRAVAPDFVLLQEVRGALFDPERAAREHVPQHRYLAEGAWPYVAYGANRFTVAGTMAMRCFRVFRSWRSVTTISRLRRGGSRVGRSKWWWQWARSACISFPFTWGCDTVGANGSWRGCASWWPLCRRGGR